MGYSFEYLDATSPTVKTDHKSDKRFELQNILIFLIWHLMRDDISSFGFYYMHADLLNDSFLCLEKKSTDALTVLPNRINFYVVASKYNNHAKFTTTSI